MNWQPERRKKAVCRIPTVAQYCVFMIFLPDGRRWKSIVFSSSFPNCTSPWWERKDCCQHILGATCRVYPSWCLQHNPCTNSNDSRIRTTKDVPSLHFEVSIIPPNRALHWWEEMEEMNLLKAKTRNQWHLDPDQNHAFCPIQPALHRVSPFQRFLLDICYIHRVIWSQIVIYPSTIYPAHLEYIRFLLLGSWQKLTKSSVASDEVSRWMDQSIITPNLSTCLPIDRCIGPSINRFMTSLSASLTFAVSHPEGLFLSSPAEKRCDSSK